MTRVFVDADIGDHHQSRDMVLHRFNGSLDDPVGIPSGTAALVLAGRNAEQDDGGNTKSLHLAGFLNQQVDGYTALSRHGCDFFAPIAPLDYEYRINKIGR